MITDMEKNFEDLQKQINATNLKLGNCQVQGQNLKDKFSAVADNEDLERTNEIRSQVDDILNECDQDTNGMTDSL